MKNYKLVIFDWDGTLMDSVERIVSSMRSAAVDVGLPIPDAEKVKNIIGLSLPEAIMTIFPGCTDENVEQLVLAYKKQYVTVDNTPTPLFEHALELLEKLKQDNRLLAVATGKGRNGLERVMAESNTNAYFNNSKCADESTSKPSPDMILQLLNELNVKAENAVVIGDTVHDMGMAKNANVDRIGVTMGVHTRDELSLFQPVAIVDSLAELSSVLLGD